MINRIVMAASALALMTAAPVLAQGALVGVEDLDERIDTIQDDVAEDMARSNDSARFGQNQYAQGWAGSLSLGLTATSGNTDTVDLALGGRFRYGNGPWNHTFGFAGEFAEDNGIRNKEQVFATYDVNRYFGESFYLFGLASAQYDGFGTNEWDLFSGFGPGYRLVNQENMTWRLQAGPGARYTRDATGAEDTELAGIAASRFYFKLTDAVFLTNDTDVLFSDASTVATNDFGVNFKMSDVLSTRMSYRTEYTSAPLPGTEKFDNTLGVSLVYGF